MPPRDFPFPGLSATQDDDALILRSDAPLHTLSSTVIGGGFAWTRVIVNRHVHINYDHRNPSADLTRFVRARGIREPFVGMMTAVYLHRMQVISLKEAGIHLTLVLTAGFGNATAAGLSPSARLRPGTINLILLINAKLAPEAVVIVVTEPVDAMTYYILKKTGFPAHRVIGMAGALDATRAAEIIAEKLGVAAMDVEAVLIGGHHNQMIFLPQYTRVSGIPVTELLSPEEIDDVEKKVRNAGHEILDLMKRATAFYAPAAATARMVETIIRERRRILSAPVYVTGEYGLTDLCIGLPILLDKTGVRRIIELQLTDEQTKALQTSAEVLRKTQATIAPRLEEVAS